MLIVEDRDRVRLLTLDRPEALNAFNEALYDAATDGLLAAEEDAEVSVVLLTGAGRAFSAGQDLHEMAQRATGDAAFSAGRHGFPGFVDALTDFSKPLVCAVNGVALGIGATLLGFADLVFMSSEARVQFPFTSLGVVPEAASSYTFPQLLGRQNAVWALMSSEWLSADECERVGLAWRVCPPIELLTTAFDHARVLASKPVSSLVETKRVIVEPSRQAIREARAREDAAFARLLGGTANQEALRAFAEKRDRR
jgi:enoyl-CoA hydratase/carnithine racemase